MTCPAQQIEDMVVRLIVAAQVPDIDAGNTYAREFPELLEKDPPITCIVVVGNDRLILPEQKTNVTWLLDYPVLVIFHKKKALTVPKADPWKKEARYIIRNTLYRHLLLGKEGVVRRCMQYDPQPRFTPVGFPQGYKVSGQLFIYRTEENRTV